jgi:hypothetical protein
MHLNEVRTRANLSIMHITSQISVITSLSTFIVAFGLLSNRSLLVGGDKGGLYWCCHPANAPDSIVAITVTARHHQVGR